MALKSLKFMANQRALQARVEKVHQAEKLAVDLIGTRRGLEKAARERRAVPAAASADTALAKLKNADTEDEKRTAVEDAVVELVNRTRKAGNK